MYTSNSRPFNGRRDGAFITHRALSSAEVLTLYKRGANRLKYQVRSCDDSACVGESFIGPDGTGSTYYTELSNSSLSTPSFTLTNVLDNRYFQYRSIFETDSTSLSPDLTSASVSYSSSGSTSTNMTASACLDLSTTLEPYIASIPEDPGQGSSGKTYYAVQKSPSGRATTVTSCGAELGADIQVTR